MIKSMLLIILILSNIVYCMTDDELENFSEKYRDNSKVKIDTLSFNNKKILFQTLFAKLNKTKNYIDSDGHSIKSHNTILGYIQFEHSKYKLFENNHVYVQGQEIIQVICKNKNSMILGLMLKHVNEGVKYGGIEYEPYLYEISKGKIKDISAENEDVLTHGFTSFNISRKNRYSYYNKEKILERLYEMNVCIRALSKLSDIEKTLKEKKDLKTYNKEFFQKLLQEKPIEKKTLTPYNNIAYYLQKANANKEAIYLLEKILEKYPNRTVAHYNLADAYWVIDDKKKAKEHYNIYIKQMKAKGKAKRIPKVVKLRALSQEK